MDNFQSYQEKEEDFEGELLFCQRSRFLEKLNSCTEDCSTKSLTLARPLTTMKMMMKKKRARRWSKEVQRERFSFGVFDLDEGTQTDKQRFQS